MDTHTCTLLRVSALNPANALHQHTSVRARGGVGRASRTYFHEKSIALRQ